MPLFRRGRARGALSLALGLTGLLAVSAAAIDLVPVPPLAARVTDQAGVLSAAEAGDLEAWLAAVEAQKGVQAAVLTVRTTAPEAIEQYALRVAEAWKLGGEKQDNGLLFLLAVDDRRMRLETGYGLEGDLTDALANRILDETVTPRLRQNDFAGGIRAGLEQAVAVLQGEPLPAAPPQRKRPGGNALQFLLIASVFAVFILPKVFGRVFRGLTAGIAVGFLSWMLLGSLLLGAVIGLLALGLGLVGVGALAAGGMGHGAGWSSRGHGGLGGFGGMGGGGGFGGFGGGGGSFGGGGASGSW
jgi:uncharacterized protein